MTGSSHAKVPARPLDTLRGRIEAYFNLIWTDHGWLRMGFQNAHWLNRTPGQEVVRANQPHPFQIAWWARRGIKTIINLRGANGMGLHLLEKEACARHGIAMHDFTIYSRAVPTRAEVEGAKAMFETIEYPAMMHCKSGSDRAGIMSVFYKHFREGLPIREAKQELSLKYGHMSAGLTGVLDYTFERYLNEGEPAGLTFLEWVQRPEYDPDQIKEDFKSTWLGRFFTEKVLRRE